jgi:predicted ATPase
MRRFIITGAPGAGKTAIIRQSELDGFRRVEEAATDTIAAQQFHDRSVVCTAALAVYLGYSFSTLLIFSVA